MNLQPIGDNILIKIETKKKKETSTGGILLINEGTEQSLRDDYGIVEAVGSGRFLLDGTLLPLTVKPGDKVMFNKYAGTEIKDKDNKYLILKETDILAIVK